MTTDDKRQKLMALGADALAAALLELAQRQDGTAAKTLVERLTASPTEAVRRVKARLAALKRPGGKFVDWRGGKEFARELVDLLADLKAAVTDPQLGGELVAAFFETDKTVLERCDDSDGAVGMVYTYDAEQLFLEYARECPDKEWLAELVFGLHRNDEYGVRKGVLVHAAEYLPEPRVRGMITDFQAQIAADSAKARKLLPIARDLARGLKDAPLFETLALANSAQRQREPMAPPNGDVCAEIAELYAECDDAHAALAWLERVPTRSRTSRHDELLVKLHGMLGDKEKQEEAAWRIFEDHRTVESLAALLALIGTEKRDDVVKDAAKKILKARGLELNDVAFLFAVGRVDDAERCLLERTNQLDGEYYDTLPQFAKELEAHGRALAASLIYRALIDSILRRAQSKAYPYGARYWKKLEPLAESVGDWRGFMPHAEYAAANRKAHSRKASFWGWLEQMDTEDADGK